ncbi:MAG: hypothetical protein AAGI01_00770 [Myxococcota bacterium]
MKIGQGQSQLQDTQLIEQMQKAHAERRDELGGAQAFDVSGAKERSVEAPKSPLTEGLVGIAEDVVTGRVREVTNVRRRVLEVIVEQRFSGLVEPGTKRQTMQTLEATLSNDPTFAREVDRMLIHAARELASR